MSEPLLEEMSPFGNIVAVVEDDGRVAYFYLHFIEPSEKDESAPAMKACWIRNRQPAPAENDFQAMKEGMPPLLPAPFCKSRGAGPPLNQEALRIVWFEEADAAALLEGNEVVAVIPSWSGEGGFSGYARDCIGESPFAWELGPNNAIRERVLRAQEFWSLWSDTTFWQRWRDERIAAVEATYGPHSKYYAIDGDRFPPRAMLRFDLPDRFIFVTIGVSLFCLPNVERYFDDPSPYRRIELAAALDRKCSADEVRTFGGYLSAQAQYPWVHFKPLGSGHTIACDCTPQSCGGNRFPAALLANSLPGVKPNTLTPFRGDPVNLLWFFPITDAERRLAMEQGTDRLLEMLSVAGKEGVIRNRESVVK